MDTEPETYKVFIHSTRKSGSTTLHATLNAHEIKNYHCHDQVEYAYSHKKKGCLYKDVIDKSIEKYGKVYIIDSYRTPIEQSLSWFFHELPYLITNYRYSSYERMCELYNSCYLSCSPQAINEAFDHYGIPHWTSFDFKRGYNIREVDNKVFIKLRFADIDHWGEYLSEIFGRPITMVADNIGEHKEYADIYKTFKAQYNVPCSYLLTIARDTEFNIYTTPKEKLEYIRKWVRKSCR